MTVFGQKIDRNHSAIPEKVSLMRCEVRKQDVNDAMNDGNDDEEDVHD
mgnify:CR=1 FL=1